jgi:uncharacterized NAD-dependent epimerase/dehydratase family protein
MWGRRTVLLAEADFSTFGSKTAVCYMRYRGDDVVAVLDSTRRGQRVSDALGFGGDVPIVGTVAEALAYRPDLAIVGVAPRGGQLEPAVRRQVIECLRAGVDVVNGLHVFLGDDREIVTEAAMSGVQIWDVRAVPDFQVVGSGVGCTTGAKTVMITGSDCNVGKMTATLELYNEAEARGLNTAWAATGQTGMMLRGRGIAIDRVISDFISGATEELVNSEGRGRDIVFVEGQGSLLHPGYAAVTLGLAFGTMPDCQVLVHASERDYIAHTEVAMPPLPDVIERYETVVEPFKRSPVVAIALNTAGFGTDVARDMIAATSKETGLPTTDPVRFGAGEILDAVLAHLS